jgi:hypothetical protein
MKLILTLLTALLLALQSLCQAAGTSAAKPMPPLASGGKPAYFIVVGRDATDSELLAVAELGKYLGIVTGTAKDGVVNSYYGSPVAEGNQGSARSIYVGWTDFAKTNGLDGSTMQPEEWAVKTVGTNLILTGGRPRGTLYAVYDFLQNDCGVHWFDHDTEVVTKNPSMVMPQVDRRGQPQMWLRYRNAPLTLTPSDQAAQERFEVRNRCPGRRIYRLRQLLYGEDPSNYNPDLGSPIWNLSQQHEGGEAFHRHCHSYYTYVPPLEFYAEHPEYFGIPRESAPKEMPKALKDQNGGKLCLTHPDVRKIVKERLEKQIRTDRVAQRSFGHQEVPRFYDLSMMDSSVPDTIECPCSQCRAFVKAHGRESDLLIDFVNDVAAHIGKQYPDVTISTTAYLFNMAPPLKVRPRDNVMVILCNWYGAPDGGPYLDQSLTHPDNKWRMDAARGWRDMGARLGVWDYLNYANTAYESNAAPVPLTIAPISIASQLFFKDLKVEWFYESGAKVLQPWTMESFASLRPWMAFQQMADPQRPVPELLDTFFSGYFGPAGGKMRAFYDLLVTCQEKPRAKKQLNNRAATLSYLTPEFYTTAQHLFDEADALTTPGSGQHLRVRQERLRLDLSLLELWGSLERQLPDGEKLPFDRAEVISRFEANSKAVLEGRSWSDKASFTKDLAREVAYFRDSRLPEDLAATDSREICDITQRYFVPWHLGWPKRNQVVDDSAAAFGKAMQFKGSEGWAATPVELKLAGLTHTVKPASFPRDGQYHLYKLGRTRLIGKDQNFKIFVNGKVTGALDLGTRINLRESASEWDVSVSAKLVGPSFSTDSGATDAIIVDRILLVRAVPGFERPADEKAALQADLSMSIALIESESAEKLYDFPVVWKFRKDPANEGESAKWFDAEPDSAWSDIRTDASWRTQEPGKDHRGIAWYSVTFTAPPLPEKTIGVDLLAADLRKLFLRFGAVDGQCWAWLDGKPIGSQLKPGETMRNEPFALDLGSELVKAGQPYRLVVKVRKDEANAGIWKPVELRVK